MNLIADQLRCHLLTLKFGALRMGIVGSRDKLPVSVTEKFILIHVDLVCSCDRKMEL